ncbi:GyrI-like domain-containing protein [Paenibacillus xylanilyticus]|uniref:Integron-associated effector binding protein domain-containing protein n=1 Tax=Paenibacillus xylanilyticus TaxID=248903 RepID=A0A7Y6C021_9BACL|nr:effector binding domain-containing protein [Paenibacillus xylanilyticus]NUU78122.1 hypothetical protein [Paenibacillus xylanilyticus]
MEHSLQELMRNARAEENTFLYMLYEEARLISCYSQLVDSRLGLFSIEIPAAQWTVFEADELAPEAIQQLWKYIMSEWFPNTSYKHAGIPKLEVYRGQGEPPQVWIPVKPI